MTVLILINFAMFVYNILAANANQEVAKDLGTILRLLKEQGESANARSKALDEIQFPHGVPSHLKRKGEK